MAEQRPADRASWDGELFRLLVENVRDYAIFVVDPDGLVRTWSHGAERLIGYREDEILGRSVDIFFTPEDVEADAPGREMRESLEAGRGVDDRWHVRKDGSRFWCSGVMTPLRDEAGRLHGFAKIMRDRTEWWHAERARKENEERLRVAFAHAAVGMAMTDPLGRLLEVNRAYCEITGYTAEELLRKDIASVTHPDDWPENREFLRRMLDGAIPSFVIEKRYARKDGTTVWAKDSVSLVRDEQGRPRRIIKLAEDITPRKEAEATIAEQIRLAEFGRDIGLALTESASLDEMLARAAGETVRHLDGAFARIWTVDEAGDVLELRASAGMYTHVDGPHARVPVGRFKIGLIARERRPHLTNSVIGDPRVPAQEWAEREGMVAFAGYPLIVEGRLVGVWAMFARHALSDATLRAMESVAKGIAIGIERKRAAEAVAESESWLSTTLNSIGDAVIATDDRGRVRFMNPVAEALTGWPQREAAGRPIADVFHIVNEQTRSPAEHPVVKVIREGVIVGLANHTVLIARDGAETPIEDSASPIKDATGKVVGVVMVFQDATERRRHEAELREGEERFRTMAESIPQLAWMAHPDGHIFWYNRRWYAYTGTTPGGMEGWGWRSVHDPAVLPDVERGWRAALVAGEPFEMEFPLLGADGVFRPFLTRVMPLRDEQGRVIRWFGTNTDISEVRRQEEEVRLARDAAENANKSKDRFLAVLSHELRTPLNPILLAATSMLERPIPPEELRPTLEMIRQNVNLQARLIDDLLDVMRIVQGKMPLHWEVADGHNLIRQAIQICQSEVFGKELRLELHLEAPEYHLNADPARFQQVIWNLVKNAVKFTPNGGVITIRTYNQAGDGEDERLVVEVSDTGIGIEPEILPLIFDPFQQGETKITRKFGGLGLGLAICRAVVESHGGTLLAESEGKDRGTRFRITLKAIPSHSVGDGEPSGEFPKARPSTSPSSLKILVVEDEPATRRLMARLLRSLGHDVTASGTIAGGVEAVEQAGARPFDLIVSDIGLPDGSGLELMRRVVARRGPIPAIALTGYGMEEDILRSREAGFTAHMTKPIDFAKLEAMIRQVAS